MRRTPAVVYAAVLAILFAALCIRAWRAGLPEAAAPPAVEALSNSEVDRRLAVMTARMSAKSHIADEVVAGRLSLLEAATAFWDLDMQEPRQSYDSPGIDPVVASENERRCRSVIEWAGNQAPPDLVPVLTRLEAELEEHLRNGTLRLRPRGGE